MSDYHPESWNPMWSVSSILTGLQSFFYEETPTSGSVTATPAARRQFARDSLEHCAKAAQFMRVRCVVWAIRALCVSVGSSSLAHAPLIVRSVVP